MNHRHRQTLTSAAETSLANFNALWPFCLQGSRLAPWAMPGADASWLEALGARGNVEQLLIAQEAGAFGAEGIAGRQAEGRSLLSWAAAHASPTALGRLPPFFNPTETDPLGRDALAFALESGRDEIGALLATRADLLARGRAGFSAMDKALLFGKKQAAAAIGERLNALEEAAQLREALGAPPSIVAKGSRRF